MALYEITGESLKPITRKTFTSLGLLERANIQRAVRTHIAAITPGVKTMVLAEEFGDWVGANRRIDLLCLDENARLVVVELKRDDSAHMELQALRYAAMVSTMRFDQAVEAHRKYLLSIGSTDDPEQAIREFLDHEEGPVALSETVRIVLASSEFQQELTTTVLWLNKQGLDIRCVQMRPHLIEDRVLLDIHQVIPLPEAAQYQVAVREKSMEQDAARVSDRDTTRYDLSIGDASFSSLPKRRLIYEIVAEALRQRVPLTGIAEAVPWRGNVFATADGQLDEAALQTVLGTKRLRYFTADDDLFHVDGNTYALSNQWGARTLEAIENILRLMPNKELVSYSPATALTDEVVYGEYLIRQCESGAIEVEQDGTQVQPVKPVLRKLAEQLGVPLQNANGNNLNTRQLGVQVMNAIRLQ
ncbi:MULTISPECIES: hypothetical protein [Ralstonia]|jgi:hypothetical protein|uniref:Nuclease of the RecB family n=1 Tax=Ralstonia pickettii OR214 TaxID=1264675 RepID=R0CF89_RALPI|nr:MULTISPECIES: hypothetical protein [Ralstonia]MEA3270416.1 hypothetical protein [Pseudomonadota bacterium]ENZ75285.1 hypothetical protein OR214_04727 [Ralstonia pickettii OR214]MBL4778865.1 hypothetical protein [Ralstonia sp.]MCM3583640.1 hypothetical protein [Ralstonia pickettii]OCS46899.1 hypothetical protein BEK67_03485 [Ralstonia pickettii]